MGFYYFSIEKLLSADPVETGIVFSIFRKTQIFVSKSSRHFDKTSKGLFGAQFFHSTIFVSTIQIRFLVINRIEINISVLNLLCKNQLLAVNR